MMVPPKEPSRGFVMLVVVVVVFISLEGFHLLLFNNIIPHPSMSYRQVYPHGYLPILYIQSSSLQNNFWHFHFNFSGLFIVPRVLRFWIAFFYPCMFFYFAVLSHILADLWLRYEQEHLIQDLHLCLLSWSHLVWLAHGLELLMFYMF